VQHAHLSDIYAMCVTLNGARLATGGKDRVIRLWDARSGRCLLELGGHSAAITSLGFASDGERLVSASWDGTVRIWDTRESCVLAVAHIPGVSKVLPLPDGRGILAGTTRGEILVLDILGMGALFSAPGG
jgi:WD40 repeat protein